MWCIGSRVQQVAVGVALVTLAAGCSALRSDESVRVVQIQQAWELQPGDAIAGHPVAGSLGDISIELDGAKVYAPFDGLVQPNNIGECVIFSSPDVPAYLFRLCGIGRPRLGEIKQGQAIGSANYLQFAALRRQPDGKWAMVEPASDILQRTLTKP